MNPIAALAVVFSVASTIHAAVVVNFDDAPSPSIPESFYAAQGLAQLRFSPAQIGLNGDGRMVALGAAYGAPSAGLCLSPYANLAGFHGDFEMVFATPMRLFLLDCFKADGAFEARAYNGDALVATQSFEPDVLRNYARVSINTFPLAFTRVVMDIPNSFPDQNMPFAGPNQFDNLTFDTVPCPGAAAIAAMLPMVLRRRR